MDSLDLTKMVNDSPETQENESMPTDIELPKEEQVAQEQVEQTTEEIKFDSILIPLTNWFDTNGPKFDNVNQVKVNVRGVESDDNIIFSVKCPKGGVDSEGYVRRELFLFKKTKNMIVPNLPGTAMNVFNNGLQIFLQDPKENILKYYIMKSISILVFCVESGGELYPWKKIKFAKNAVGFNFEQSPISEADVRRKMLEDADTETLQLQYKQIQKTIDKIKSKGDAMNWLLAVQKLVTDVNHLQQIDEVLINILTS